MAKTTPTEKVEIARLRCVVTYLLENGHVWAMLPDHVQRDTVALHNDLPNELPSAERKGA